MDRRAFLRASVLLPAAGVTGCGVGDILGTSDALRVAVSWSAAELQAFRSVLDDVLARASAQDEQLPRVDLVPLGDQIDAAMIARGASQPDVVMLPRPGLVLEHKDDLVSLEKAWNLAEEPSRYAAIWHELLVDKESRLPYGVPFKAAHKSLVWYRKSVFPNLPDFDDLGPDRQLALGAADGWVLTDFFENFFYSVSPELYRSFQRAEPGEREWRCDEVRTAFDQLGNIWGKPHTLAGGVDRSMTLQFPDAVREVFQFERAAMVVAPDFAKPFIADAFSDQDELAAEVGVRRFPSLGRDEAIAGGDVAVVTKRSADSGAAVELVQRLTQPGAAKSWIEDRGGFIPIEPGDLSRYDRELRTPGLDQFVEPLMNGTGKFAFDLSDQLGVVGGFGGLWKVLREFLNDVRDVGDDQDAVTGATGRAVAKLRVLEDEQAELSAG